MQECKWFIEADDYQLKNKFGKMLLYIIYMDAKNGIYPLAIVVCEPENKDSQC